MNCPKCPGKLEKKNFKAKDKVVEIDQCFSCQGIWFDKAELEKLKEFSLTKFELDSQIDDHKAYKILDAKTGICPRCNKEMRKKEIDVKTGKEASEGDVKVRIDACDNCQGFWVDGNEINYLVEILPSEVGRLKISILRRLLSRIFGG